MGFTSSLSSRKCSCKKYSMFQNISLKEQNKIKLGRLTETK